MKVFFIKFTLLLLLFAAIDRLAGVAMKNWSRALTPDQRMGQLLDGMIRSDLVVLGSSRAVHHIAASEVGTIAGISAYNLGVAGSNIDFHTYLLSLLLSTGHTPRYLLIAVDASEVKDDPSINFRFDLMYPHASDVRVSRMLVERGQLDEYLSVLLYTYREKLGFIEVFRPYALFRKPKHEIKTDGFTPLNGKSVSIVKQEYKRRDSAYSTVGESPRLVVRFAELVSQCKKNNIKLVLVVSPNFASPLKGLSERLFELSEGGAIVLDYSAHAEFRRKDLFHDVAHLNSEGALLLSRKIGEDMKKIHDGKDN